jgi:hypothetical protein
VGAEQKGAEEGARGGDSEEGSRCNQGADPETGDNECVVFPSLRLRRTFLLLNFFSASGFVVQLMDVLTSLRTSTQNSISPVPCKSRVFENYASGERCFRFQEVLVC